MRRHVTLALVPVLLIITYPKLWAARETQQVDPSAGPSSLPASRQAAENVKPSRFKHLLKIPKSIDAPAGDEQKGVFHDDLFPLEYAANLTERDYRSALADYPPKSEIQCKTGSEQGIASTPWGIGFYQGMAGQRYVFEITFGDEEQPGTKLSPLSPKRADRRVCDKFTPGSNEFACCYQGALAAEPVLAKKLDLASKQGSDKGSQPGIDSCLKQFRDGIEYADFSCSKVACPASTGVGPVRYLGCYTLGYSLSTKRCAAAESTAQTAQARRVSYSQNENKSDDANHDVSGSIKELEKYVGTRQE